MSRNASKCGQNMTWHDKMLDNNAHNEYVFNLLAQSYNKIYALTNTTVSKNIHVYFIIHVKPHNRLCV